jgi:hypothetical protein
MPADDCKQKSEGVSPAGESCAQPSYYLLITMKAEELEFFLTSLAFRLGPMCTLIRNGLLSTKFLRQLWDKLFINSHLLLQVKYIRHGYPHRRRGYLET